MSSVKVSIEPILDTPSFAIDVESTEGAVIYKGAIRMQDLFVAMDKEQYACAVVGQKIFFMEHSKIKPYLYAPGRN